MDEPTPEELARLRSLMERTHDGPRLAADRLCGPGVRAWIAALEPVALAMDALEELEERRGLAPSDCARWSV